MRVAARRVPDLVYGEVLGYRPLELDLYLPQTDRPQTDRPQTDRPQTDRPQTDRPQTDGPQTDGPQTDGPVPVIVHVHGGGWRRGSRREPLPVLGADFYDSLTAQGFAVAAVDYRLSGEARFPAPVEDVRTAIGWVRDHAASYGLDAGRVFGWGDSAGGHLVLLAALTGAKVHGVVAWFPVTDLVGLAADVAEAGGVPDPGPESREALLLGTPAASAPDLARQASPVTHASTGAPPILLMHGAVDDLVPPAQSVRLAEALGAAGATVELELVPGATHFWDGASDVNGIVRRSIEFLRACG